MWPPSLSQVLVMVLFGSILLTGIFILLSQAGSFGSNQRKVTVMSSPTPIQLGGMSHGTSVPGYAVNETPTHKALDGGLPKVHIPIKSSSNKPKA